jgi:hypothetical protein
MMAAHRCCAVQKIVLCQHSVILMRLILKNSDGRILPHSSGSLHHSNTVLHLNTQGRGSLQHEVWQPVRQSFLSPRVWHPLLSWTVLLHGNPSTPANKHERLCGSSRICVLESMWPPDPGEHSTSYKHQSALLTYSDHSPCLPNNPSKPRLLYHTNLWLLYPEVPPNFKLYSVQDNVVAGAA